MRLSLVLSNLHFRLTKESLEQAFPSAQVNPQDYHVFQLGKMLNVQYLK